MDITLTPLLHGFVSPVDAISWRGGLLVADQVGLVYFAESTPDGWRARVIMDLSSRMHPVDPNYDESGLLAVLVANSRLYVFYTRADGVDVVSSFAILDEVDPTSEVVHLVIPLGPTSGGKWVHHGGRLALDADGSIYVAVGDGGPQRNEPGFTARSQDPTSVHGKVVRLRDGTPTIYASGLRNPYGLTLVSGGPNFVADVGWNRREEINLLREGANYGWPAREGTLLHDTPVPGETLPVIEYDHSQIRELQLRERGDNNKPPVAVIGGRYLDGRYIFGDISGYLFVAEPKTRVEGLVPFLNLVQSGWAVTRVVVLPPKTYVKSIADHNGLLLALTSQEMGPKGRSGVVWRVDL